MKGVRKLVISVAAAAAAALVAAAVASAHARISPSVVVKDAPEVFTLSVPTEKEGATTTKIALTVPSDFPIDSVEPPPAGWTMQEKATGTGENESIQGVTWTGGHVPTGQAAMFRFAAQANKTGSITFSVRQTYSDGSVVDWNGPESSDTPSPVVKSLSSFGGGGTSTIEIVTLILAVAALVVAILALVAGRGGEGKRPLT